MDVRFVIMSPASRKAAHAVRLPVLVGRSDEAKFRVQQDSVSRRHCELFLQDDAVFVRDLGSTNGTLINGERIAASTATVVPPGAQIRVGGVVFRVEYEPTACAAAEERGDDTVPMAVVDRTSESPEPDAEPQPDAEPATESAGFNFLGGAAAEPESGGDDQLDDFFKSLK